MSRWANEFTGTPSGTFATWRNLPLLVVLTTTSSIVE